MKYWSFLLAKLAAASLLVWGAWAIVYSALPAPGVILHHQLRRFGQDFRWTAVILAFWLCSVGLLALIVWDQRRRCRVCLRRLRMPVEKGSWARATLFSPPRLESICPYGHGTLKVPEVHNASSETTEWRRHRSIWEELESVEEREP